MVKIIIKTWMCAFFLHSFICSITWCIMVGKYGCLYLVHTFTFFGSEQQPSLFTHSSSPIPKYPVHQVMNVVHVYMWPGVHRDITNNVLVVYISEERWHECGFRLWTISKLYSYHVKYIIAVKHQTRICVF